MLTFPELVSGGTGTRPQVLRLPACPRPHINSAPATKPPEVLIKNKNDWRERCVRMHPHQRIPGRDARKLRVLFYMPSYHLTGFPWTCTAFAILKLRKEMSKCSILEGGRRWVHRGRGTQHKGMSSAKCTKVTLELSHTARNPAQGSTIVRHADKDSLICSLYKPCFQKIFNVMGKYAWCSKGNGQQSECVVLIQI